MPIMTIGAVALHRVEELRIPNRISYFTSDAELLAANRHWLAPHFLDENDRFDLVFQSWIFEIDGRVVLVDPCTGNGRPNPVHFFDNLDVPFIDRLHETGFRCEDIDFVVCTHLHHDHCGWNTQLRDGKWVPTFPNARYVMRQAEYDRWGPHRERYPTVDYNEGVFERSVLPVVEAGLADLVSGSHRLTPGLVLEPAPGHTARSSDAALGLQRTACAVHWRLLPPSDSVSQTIHSVRRQRRHGSDHHYARQAGETCSRSRCPACSSTSPCTLRSAGMARGQ